MESSDNHIDPENEVKKLQALVKKLEKQNELLRSKQKVGLDGEQSEGSLANGDVGETAETLTTHSHQVHAHPPSDAVKHKATDVGLEDVDVLDVDNLSLKDEEDSWLYSSPKPLTPQQSNINLYKWVRQDFDHPSPELQSARRSLLSRLDEVARMNRSCSTPVLGSTMSPAKTSSLLSRSTEDSRKYHSHYTDNSHRKHSSPSHQRHSMLATAGSRVENGTFTRRKKPEEHNGVLAGDKEKSEEGTYHTREGTDVEKLARQQEDSLRQSMTTYPSPKRVLHNKSMSIASDTDNSASPAGSNRSSPGRFDYEGSFFSRHRNSFGSDCSTPPDSPGIFQQHSTPYPDQATPGGGRSAVSRLQLSSSSTHSCDSNLEHQAADSTDDLHLAPETRSACRLPAPGFRSASPAGGGGGTRLPSAAHSQGSLPPQRSSGLPTARRGIPRPAASSSLRSSLPTARRSGIPSPRQSSAPERDQSWREGCF